MFGREVLEPNLRKYNAGRARAAVTCVGADENTINTEDQRSALSHLTEIYLPPATGLVGHTLLITCSND